VRRAAPYHTTITDFRRRLIETTLEEHGGNRTHAAQALGIQRTYLLRLIRDLGIVTPSRRSSGGRAEHSRGARTDGEHDIVTGSARRLHQAPRNA
jgi:hypothetical protein